MLVLIIVCAGVVLASLDLFIVNVALPKIARDLHQRSLSDLSWVLNGYAIVYAALLVLVGRLSEGRRRDNGFLVGALIFTAASAARGWRPSMARAGAARPRRVIVRRPAFGISFPFCMSLLVHSPEQPVTPSGRPIRSCWRQSGPADAASAQTDGGGGR